MVSIFEYDQAKALRDAGHTVRIVSIDIRSIFYNRSYTPSTYTTDGIKTVALNFPLGRSTLSIKNLVLRKMAKKGYSLITQDGWKPEVIHAHFSLNGYAFSSIATTYNIPFVVTEHSSQVNKKNITRRHLKRAIEAYKGANVLIAVSSALASSIYYHTRRKALVIPNILDSSSFTSNIDNKKDTFMFVSTGNLIPLKNMDILLKAFSMLEDKTCSLVIFGQGKQKDNLEQLAKILKIDSRVTFKGHVPRGEMSQVYEKASCFVLPSSSETFGVAYIEAMAMGLPVIATRCGGPEDFVVDEVGVLIPKNDVDSLAQAMAKMIETASLYDPIFISTYVKERFSPHVVATQLTEIYQTLQPHDS